MANNTLASCCIAIRINEPTNGGVVIPALEVVEPGFLVVDIPTVAQRVDICQRARSGNDFPVRVIVVACDNVLAGVHNPHHVPLQVGDVVVRRAVVLHGIGQAAGIVEEVNGIGSPGHAHQLTAGVVVAVGIVFADPLGTDAAGVVRHLPVQDIQLDGSNTCAAHVTVGIGNEAAVFRPIACCRQFHPQGAGGGIL